MSPRFVPALLGLAACHPFVNQAPRLVHLNDAPFHSVTGFGSYDAQAFQAQLGEDFPIEVGYHDPEGDPVRVWWLRAPPGLEFDPDGTTGVWHVPEELLDWPEFTLILEDQHPTDPAMIELPIPIEVQGAFDTGFW